VLALTTRMLRSATRTRTRVPECALPRPMWRNRLL
jgi:hypothetical protein